MPRRYYSSTAVETTLTAQVSNSATTFPVASTSGFPAQTPYTLIVDEGTVNEEVVTVTGVSTLNLTVTRGVDGTSAVSHANGATVKHGVSARDFDEANSHVNDTTTDVHSQYVSKSLVNAKGDLVTATANDTPAILTAGSNGQTLVADSTQTNGLRYIDAQTARNAIINGNFAIWARGTSFTSANVYTADRWYKDDIGHTTVSRQSSGLTGFQYSLRSQRNSGQSSTSNYGVVHSLESADALQLAGKTATVSFYAKAGANFSPTSSVLKLLFAVGTGTDQKRTFAAALTGETTLTTDFTLTTSWQRFSVSWSVATTTTALALQFYASPTGTAGANDWFEITGVQLEASPVATPFEFEPYEATLRKCQRYYYRQTPGAAGPILGTGWNSSTTKQQVWTPFPVPMRTAPTALEQNGTASHYKVAHAATTTNLSAVATFVSASTVAAQTEATVASGLTAGDGSALQSNDATAYLAWSAEL